jgi:tetratricopeptide (TPR) repeat protein
MRLVQAIAHRWLGNYAMSERYALEAMRSFPRGSTPWYAAAGHLAIASGSQGKREHLTVIAKELRAIEANGRVTGSHMITAFRLVVFLIRMGMASEAQQAFESALRRPAKYARAEPMVRASLAVARAEVAVSEGDPMRYMRHVASAVEAFREAGDVRSTCHQRTNIGNAYLQLGGYEQAEVELRWALTIAEPMKLGFVASLRANLGFVLARLQRLDEAAAVESAALEQCAQQGHRRFECVAQIYMALINSLRGEVDAAIELAERAVEGSPDFPAVNAYAHATLAGLLLVKDQPAAALSAAEEAMGILERLKGVEEGESQIRVVHASALYAAGSTGEALRRIQEATARLHARAARISDPRWRRTFLEDIPENARTLRLAARWGAHSAEGG